MKEIKNWNGHHVLAIFSLNDTLNAMKGLARDLTGKSSACELCPAWDATKPDGDRCTIPAWYLPLERGGCAGYLVIAEEYIPLVRMRIGGSDGD